MIFFYYSSVEKLKEFEKLKGFILKKLKTDEVKIGMEKLIKEIGLIEEIESMHNLYKECFWTVDMDWRMDYDIAKDVLQYEIERADIRYQYGLINYLFAYLLSPDSFKKLFFLRHGFVLDPNDGKIIKDLRKREYIIFKRGQELSMNYLVYENEISHELNSLMNLGLRNHGLPEIDKSNAGNIYIFQFFKE